MTEDVSRRTFLGAAAAVWNLPHSDQLRLYTETPPEEIPDGEGEKEYPREVRHGGFSGSISAEQYSDDVSFAVEMYPFQAGMPVALEVVLDGISMGAGLEPDQARVIGQSLLAAADEVEAWREQHWDDHMKKQYGGADADE